jgi:hypothetical protein
MNTLKLNKNLKKHGLPVVHKSFKTIHGVVGIIEGNIP